MKTPAQQQLSRGLGRPLRAALLTVLAAGLAACGSDSGVSDADTGTADVETPETDVGLDIDIPDTQPEDEPDVAPDTPDVPQPIPGVPELVVVELAPTRAVFPLGIRITPTATVYDQTGAVLRDPPITWRVTPNYAVEEVEEKYEIVREGVIRFTACTPADDTSDLSLCGWREIHADASLPFLEITSPLPGEELLAEEHPMIEVTGRARDSNGKLSVYVNGERVGLDADGNFATSVLPRYGINHIAAVASDGLNRFATVRGVDVMWAPHYLPSQTDPEAGTIVGSYPDALVFRLNQKYLDSDEPIIIDPDDPVLVSRDIASLLEFVLSEIDVVSYLPDMLVDSDTLTVDLTDGTIGSPRVDIRVTRKGLEFFISFADLMVESTGQFILDDRPISLNGTVGLVASAYVALEIHKLGPDEPLVVRIETIDIALEDAWGEFDEPGIGAIVELAEGLFFESLEGFALDLISESFVDTLPEMLDEIIGSIETGLADIEVPLDLGLGGEPITLTINGQLDEVRPESRAGLQMDLSMDIGSNRVPTFPDSRGTAMDVPFEQEPTLFENSRVQVGVRVPMLNGLFHTLWNSGLLDLDVSEMIPPDLAFVMEGATIKGLLPPHLTAARPGISSYALVVTLGELQLEMWRADRRDRVGINVSVGADIVVVDNIVKLEIQTEPTIEMWMIEQMGPQPLFEDIQALESLFISAIWPMLTEDLVSGLEFELPALDLAALGEFAPRLSDLTLELVLDQPVKIREGYFVLDGAFEGVADLSD